MAAASIRENPYQTRWIMLADREEESMESLQTGEFRIISGMEELTIHTMTRPEWASAIGRDSFGLWAEFTVRRAVTQRLRWVPPGRFLMGSPAEEAGRSVLEGRRRMVQIRRGFWLFDTCCTQALWDAAMANNPSRFRSPSRPVEQVSWDDCRAFTRQLNEMLDGLVVSLPSEAQWEHACRKGSLGINLPCTSS